MMEWQILDTGIQSAEENMRMDAQLLENADCLERPVLHWYDWSGDSATYGHFISPEKLLNMNAVQAHSLQLAKRPTGGGIVFHIWDLAFSVIVPACCPEFSLNTLHNYAFVNHAVLNTIKEFLNNELPLSLTPQDCVPWDANCAHFCMAKPTQYDVMWETRKIAGAAQRKTRQGFLHQGTIALIMPPTDYLEEILLPGTKVQEAMLAHTSPLLGHTATQEELRRAKSDLRTLLATHLRRCSLSLTA